LKASKAISGAALRTEAWPTSAAPSSTTDDRFRLTGPSARPDPRVNAYRDDLADIALVGHVLAPHYARALARACGAHAALMWPAPRAEGDAVSELLPGEGFAVLEYAAGWAWGHCARDGVVGYVEAIALAAPAQATHIVCEASAPVAPDRDLASPPLASLPMGARLRGEERGACLATEYGCVALSHLRRIDVPEPDPVAVAERLLGAPWRAGGRTAAGIDGPGLVQLALGLAGIAAPRFADQLAAFGAEIPAGAPRARGDLIVYPGGAGLMIDDLLMIHAGPEAGHVAVGPATGTTGARRGLA
jgi:hypothetical protein